MLVVMAPGGSEDSDLPRKAFGEGADIFLAKPVPADRLRDVWAGLPEREKQKTRRSLTLFASVICHCDFGRSCSLRSTNISGTGTLLQGTHNLERKGLIARERVRSPLPKQI